jgi:hypothetical protein
MPGGLDVNSQARLAVALLAAAVSHTPEGEEVLRGARMRMARKPSAVARELLRNFPKGGKRRRTRGKRNQDKNGEGANGTVEAGGKQAAAAAAPDSDGADEVDLAGGEGGPAAAGEGDDEVAAGVDPGGDA